MRGLCVYADPANGSACGLSGPSVCGKALAHTHTHTHTEDCLSISMHKGKSGIQVVSVSEWGVTALMVQFGYEVLTWLKTC